MKKGKMTKSNFKEGQSLPSAGEIKSMTSPSDVLFKDVNPETNFAEIFTFSPYGILILSRDGWITNTNLKASTLLGATEDELILTDFRKLIKRDSRKKFVQTWLKLRHSGMAQSCELSFGKPDKSILYAQVDLSFAGAKKGDQVVVTLFDLTMHKMVEDVQTFLLNLAFLQLDTDFFEMLAKYLGNVLNMEYVCIDRLLEGGEEAQTVAVHYKGQFQENVRYCLADTPCGKVAGRVVCCFPADVRHLFPKDQVLQDMGAESYAGVTLWGSKGNPIGLIAVIGVKPLENPSIVEAVLKQVSVRAAAELERIDSESALQLSEERYKNSLNQMLEGCQIIDFDWKYIYLNDSAALHGQKNKEEMLGKSMLEIYPGIENTEMFGYLNKCMTERIHHRMENEFNFPDGSSGWFELSILPVPEGIFILSYDITKRKKAEDELKKSEKKASALIEHAPTGIFEFDFGRSRMVKVNDTLCKLLGYSREELLSIDVSILLVEESQVRFNARMKMWQEGGDVPRNVDYQVRKKNGDIVEVILNVSFIRGGDGPDSAMVVVHDITERKRMEQKLQLSERRSRILAEAPFEGILIYRDGVVNDINSSLSELLGYSRDELLGTNVQDYVDPSFHSLINKRLKDPFEIEVNHKDGRKIPVEVRAKQFDGPDQLIIAIRDITERKQKEKTLEIHFRMLNILIKTGRAMLEATNEMEYISSISRIIKEECSYPAIWIGYLDRAMDILSPVSYFGFGETYPDFFQSNWKDDPMNPLSRVIQKAELSIHHNIENDKGSGILREVYKLGYKSSIIFPLKEADLVFGVLSVFDRSPEPFTDDEIILLNKLANDLAQGISMIRMRMAHHEAEKSLQESEKRFRLALKHAPVSVAAQDKDLRFIWAYNQRSWSQEDIIGKTDKDLFPKDADHLIALKRHVIETGEEIRESLWLNSHGGSFYLDVFLEPLKDSKGNITGVGVATVDLTPMKQAESDLLQSKQDLDRAQEVASIGWWRLDTQLNVLTWSDENHRIFGVPKGVQMSYESFLDLVHPEDRAYVDACWNKSLKGAPYDIEHRIIVDGKVRWIREKAYLEFDRDNALLGGFGISQDITFLKEAEEALRQNETILSGILNSVTESIWLFDSQGFAIMGNQTAFNRLGLPPENIIGKSLFDIFLWDIADFYLTKIRETIKAGKPIFFEEERNGLWFENVFYPLINQEDIIQSIAIFSRNITHQKLIEKELIESRDILEAQVLERTTELRKINKQLREEIRTKILKEKALKESQSLLRALTQQINAVSEEERTKISREIHDELGHQLTAMKYEVEAMMHDKEGSRKVIDGNLPSILTMIESLIDSIRKIATELRPGILDQLGLIPAIEWQIAQFKRRTSISCEYISTEIGRTFNKDETTIIFRILQEILTNIIRHANANRVIVRLEDKNEWFQLKVRDNGVGFEVKENLLKGSLGLIGMKERALSIGGEIKIKSAPGMGCEIIFRLKKQQLKVNE